jgi:hypothetical protein
VRHRKIEIISLAVLIGASAGCRREEIRVYMAPKDPPPRQEVAHSPHDGHDHGEAPESGPRSRPQVSWKLPEGWREGKPGQMSVATFSIRAGDQEAEVSITPLGMMAGREDVIVNMFRETLGLKSLTAEETAKELQDVTVGGEKGKLFELAGKSDAGEPATRIVTVMAHRDDASWFYKLAGDAALVEAQKPAFLEFLKSIQIKEPAATDRTSTAAESGKPKWEVPADWKPLPAGQMQVARFGVPPRNGASGEVFVSVFPSDTGGTLANVNRWRRQLKLPEVNEKDLASLVTPLDPAIPNALLVDLTNNTQRMLGAIVPREGQWWFYKLLGDSAAVAPERENFIRFAKSSP